MNSALHRNYQRPQSTIDQAQAIFALPDKKSTAHAEKTIPPSLYLSRDK
jgi:hypothetical protein